MLVKHSNFIFLYLVFFGNVIQLRPNSKNASDPLFLFFSGVNIIWDNRFICCIPGCAAGLPIQDNARP